MRLDFEIDEGIGTRARLGLVLLATDETLEGEIARLLPGGVALHVSRIAMATDVREETLKAMEARLPDAAGLLPAPGSYDAVGFACTSAASVIGPSRIADALLRSCPGARATDPLSAAIAAARAIGARRLAYVSPYVASVSASMRARLTDAGLHIVAFGSFEEGDDRVVARISPASILKAVETVAANAGDCDAVFVSCTNLRTLGIIEAAEAATGRTVLSSNQVLAWHMLRLAGVDDAMAGAGRLFRHA